MTKQPGKRSQQQNDFLEPGTPINVVATNVGTNRAFNDGAASVSFQQPEGSSPADSFTVTAFKGAVEDLTATNLVGTSSPIIVGGLDSNANYKFTVTATNASGSTVASEFSPTILITTVPATPAAPTVSNTSNSQVDTLSWSPPANGGSALISYFYESTDNKSGSGAATVTTFTVNQEGGTRQQYRIRVTNANGTSEWSPYSPENFTPPFFPPFFPFFPPFFPFFPFFPPMFPFFPFFPPMFPFFPFFPPMFPFFPFFPPMFPFFPPYFPPMFPPFFPFFPFFPGFKARRCLAPQTEVLTTNGWKEAGSLSLEDKILTVDSSHIDVMSLIGKKLSSPLDGTLRLVEADIRSITEKTSKLVGYNNLGMDYSATQPILVKTLDGVSHKTGEEIEVGDTLIGVDEFGSVSETVVESIQQDDFESTVYDVRTSPQPWFITKLFLVIA
jgi:hypothetical protein